MRWVDDSQEIAEIVGERMKLEPHRVGRECPARQPRPLDRAFAFLDALLACSALGSASIIPTKDSFEKIPDKICSRGFSHKICQALLRGRSEALLGVGGLATALHEAIAPAASGADRAVILLIVCSPDRFVYEQTLRRDKMCEPADVSVIRRL